MLPQLPYNLFLFKGRGTVATGRVEQGIIKFGDEVEALGLMHVFFDEQIPRFKDHDQPKHGKFVDLSCCILSFFFFFWSSILSLVWESFGRSYWAFLSLSSRLITVLGPSPNITGLFLNRMGSFRLVELVPCPKKIRTSRTG
ncbi:hypothetical protein S83_021364 [Arachis hypogaea]